MKDKLRLITPETAEGIPNLEVRRMMRELEQEKQPPTIHQQTAKQVSLHLDRMQKLTQEGKVQGMTLVALLLKGAHPDGEALTLFSAPDNHKPVARELLKYSYGWLDECRRLLDSDPDEAG